MHSAEHGPGDGSWAPSTSHAHVWALWTCQHTAAFPPAGGYSLPARAGSPVKLWWLGSPGVSGAAGAAASLVPLPSDARSPVPHPAWPRGCSKGHLCSKPCKVLGARGSKAFAERGRAPTASAKLGVLFPSCRVAGERAGARRGLLAICSLPRRPARLAGQRLFPVNSSLLGHGAVSGTGIIVLGSRTFPFAAS